jgi:CDP-6-deoxy-D-xylo-4-hexulose-3-dehydrase
MTEVVWPLMKNNISRADLDALIIYLKQDDPKLTHGPLVRALTMMALKELEGGGEVIVPPLTWVSDVSSVIRAGLDPVFVDIDPRSLALDTKSVLKSVTPKTKAVFITHVLGYNGLTDELIDGLKERDVLLIEDACESHGALHNGKKVGSFGWASNFSFYYAHHMTTIEGGMVSTNDPKLYDTLRILRSHGMVRESFNEKTREKYARENPELNSDFIFAYASHNMRPTELSGLLGLEQLKRLDDNNLKRTRNLEKFLSVLNPKVFRTEFKVQGSSNYAFTLVLNSPNIEKRDLVEKCLKEAGIEFRRGLSGGGNQLRQPYLKSMKSIPKPESVPVTEHIHHYSWYIGNYPELSHDQIEWLGSILNEI